MPRFTVFFLLLGLFAKGDLVPEPRLTEKGSGNLIVDVQTTVIAPKNLAPFAEVLTKALSKTTGYSHRFRTIQQVGRMTFKRAIRLSLADSEKAQFYRIEITAEGAKITGSDLSGLMHGIQTFCQLLPIGPKPFPRALLPAQLIEDWPETPTRIFHLDVSAYLFPAADLKNLIDWLSFHKLNELHLQLNGDHGWRMESLAFPKLHQIGSVRSSSPPYGDPTGSDSTEYGGYYTQEVLKDLVAFGQSRAVSIIPTFTLSTGASALIASYPELGKEPVKVANTWQKHQVGILENESSLEFLKTLFAEVATIFPAPSIRIEGSSSPFYQKLTPSLLTLKKNLFFSNNIPTTNFSVYPRPKEAELLADPTLEAEEGFNPVQSVYQLKPGKTAQATLRTHYVPDFAKLQHLVFPRLAAFAEVTWLPAPSHKYEDFRRRLDILAQRYRFEKILASQTYDPPVNQTLHNTKVTSSIKTREGYTPTMIFDGRTDTFLWSPDGLQKDDHLTLEFPWPTTGELSITTGQTGREDGILETGILEFSTNGNDWTSASQFFSGAVLAKMPDQTRFARVRVTAAQETPLIMAEFSLSPPLLAPRHEESREIQISVDRKTFEKKMITLTFKANFEDHPELREEIQLARTIFFTEWLELATKIGTATFPDTPRDFEIKPGEPGQDSPEATRQWVLKRLIPRIQKFPVSVPLWLSSGLTARLLGDISKEPDRKNYRKGGAESAAFLDWIGQTYGEATLIAISQECRNGYYSDARWQFFTNKSLAEMATLYQNAK